MSYRRYYVRSIALAALVVICSVDALAASPFDEREGILPAGTVLLLGVERHPDSDPGAFSDCEVRTPHYLFAELCRLVLADRYLDAETLYVSQGLIDITGLRRSGPQRCAVETSDSNGTPDCSYRFVRLRQEGISVSPAAPATNVGVPQPLDP